VGRKEQNVKGEKSSREDGSVREKADVGTLGLQTNGIGHGDKGGGDRTVVVVSREGHPGDYEIKKRKGDKCLAIWEKQTCSESGCGNCLGVRYNSRTKKKRRKVALVCLDLTSARYCQVGGKRGEGNKGG